MTIDSPTAFCSFGDEHPGSVHQSRITSCGANDVGQFANHVELLSRFSTLMGVRTWTRAYRRMCLRRRKHQSLA